MKTATIAASAIPDDWIALVWKIVNDGGYAVRGPTDVATIEVKSQRDNRWRHIMLFSSVELFESIADRDAVLAKIVAPLPPNPAFYPPCCGGPDEASVNDPMKTDRINRIVLDSPK